MAKKVPYSIHVLAKELAEILASYFVFPNQNDGRIPLKDRLAVKLILTLNKPFYRYQLLFRDYSLSSDEMFLEFPIPPSFKDEALGCMQRQQRSGSKNKKTVELSEFLDPIEDVEEEEALDSESRQVYRVHTESIFYTQEVLGSRLTIVSHMKSLPNNLHRLLEQLCRHSLNKNWSNTIIERRKNSVTENCASFFKDTANKLKNQVKNNHKVSSVSETYRTQYGAFQLTACDNSAVVPEEISLFDVVEALPVPLKPEFLQHKPDWFAPLVERIVISLNDKYGLLRSCGLAPELWHKRLSSGKLRDLKQLKKGVDKILESESSLSMFEAYRMFFLEMKKEQSKIAGFKDFDEFRTSELGTTLLKENRPLSFNQASKSDQNSRNFEEIISSSTYIPSEMQMALFELLSTNKNYFTPLTAYFFEQTVILMHSPKEIIKKDKFKALLAEAAKFSALSDQDLITALFKKVQQICEKHLETSN